MHQTETQQTQAENPSAQQDHLENIQEHLENITGGLSSYRIINVDGSKGGSVVFGTPNGYSGRSNPTYKNERGYI